MLSFHTTLGKEAYKFQNTENEKKKSNSRVDLKGTLSRTFFGFFSEMAPKLQLSTFNHAGNAPKT